MVDAYAVDFFFARDPTELTPARDRQPAWRVRNRGDDLHGITGAASEVLYTLMDKNCLERIYLVGIKSCEGQDSQAQSMETRFARTGQRMPACPKVVANGRRYCDISFSSRTGETSILRRCVKKPAQEMFPADGEAYTKAV